MQIGEKKLTAAFQSNAHGIYTRLKSLPRSFPRKPQNRPDLAVFSNGKNRIFPTAKPTITMRGKNRTTCSQNSLLQTYSTRAQNFIPQYLLSRPQRLIASISKNPKPANPTSYKKKNLPPSHYNTHILATSPTTKTNTASPRPQSK